jgi:hypothetical protein
MTRREERAIRSEVRDLVAEAEAMLAGRLLERPGWNDTELGWVCLSTLAHCEFARLTELAAGVVRCRQQDWDAALRFLASDLLALAGTRAALAAVQRAHLVPLELDLMTGASLLSSPIGLVDLVRPELAKAASRRRHPSTG